MAIGKFEETFLKESEVIEYLETLDKLGYDVRKVSVLNTLLC